MGEVFVEAHRLWMMRSLESGLGDVGLGPVAGVDEAGRGCLAGPVVAAAVLVGNAVLVENGHVENGHVENGHVETGRVASGRLVPGVDDSKKISAAKRARLADQIRRAHPVHAVAMISPQQIDRINILQATKLAMLRALEALRPQPGLAIVDAVALEAPMQTLSLVKGDQLSYAVACASILAKTERDRYMLELHERFPNYAFDSNKGYGSAAHRRALVEYGPCEQHRLTFGSVLPSSSRAGSRPTAGAC